MELTISQLGILAKRKFSSLSDHSDYDAGVLVLQTYPVYAECIPEVDMAYIEELQSRPKE